MKEGKKEHIERRQVQRKRPKRWLQRRRPRTRANQRNEDDQDKRGTELNDAEKTKIHIKAKT